LSVGEVIVTLRIACVVCARNEIGYLRTLVPYLLDQDIDLTLIDNESTDGTAEWLAASPYAGRVAVHRLSYSGVFDLTSQLALKAQVIETLRSDWVIHHDADEILQGPDGWGTLRAAIEEADAAGYDALNFDELVMLPLDPNIDAPYVNNRLCYFFEPQPLRLMRAWRRSAELSNQSYGGHRLDGAYSLSPARPLLKHFIVRSQAHAYAKYLHRRFPEHDLSKGWHRNRLSFTTDNLTVPTRDPRLTLLPTPQATPTVMPEPQRLHFWQWAPIEAAAAATASAG
jgi:glycosyltransferase involved in cell wall biosynthesis